MTDWKAITDKKAELYQGLPQEIVDEYAGKSGVYGLYILDHLVYIGESSDILNRWIAHKINTLYDYGQKDYKEEKYAILREAWNRNYPISCRVLEYCKNDKQVLRTREKEWIKQCQPILNGGRATIGFKGWEFLMNLPTCEKKLDN